MAAACVLWWREAGDRYAVRVFAKWLALRLRALAVALRRRRWHAAVDELLVLGGTGRGVAYGWREARTRE
jgi:hypothetical protein